MSEYIIRDYCESDWGGVNTLLYEGYKSIIDKDTFQLKYLSDSCNVLIAEEEKTNKVVGCILWKVNEDYVRPNKTLYLSYLIVKKEYRRKGIARDLYSRLESLCKEKCCSCIEFTSANYRTGAHELYKSMGYTIKNTSIFIKEI